MANKNKNTKKLVAHTDDDPTSEFEIPDFLRSPQRNFEPEIEVDEQTFDIDDVQTSPHGRSRAELKSALSEQAKLVEVLNFEIEQLSSRRRGLEEELKARKEITDNINSEVQESRIQLGEAVRALETRNEEYDSTKTALNKANSLIERLNDTTSGLKIATKDFKRKIKSLESDLATGKKRYVALEKELRNKPKSTKISANTSEKSDNRVSARKLELETARTDLADLRNYVDGRKGEWAQLRAKLVETHDQLDIQRKETERLGRDVDEKNAQLVRSREQYIKASEQLLQQKAKVRKLSKKNRELDRTLNRDARQEIVACQARIAEQSGELAARLQELKGLRNDNGRIEQYSDALRIQLQDQVSISKVSVAIRHKLEAGLDAANEMVNKLSDELNTEQQLNKDHADMVENLQQEYEREVRQIRFELGAAEETLAGQETLNEQLASDLIDNQGFRQALETQINEVEKENKNTILALNAKLQRTRQDADDYERKLRTKDSAIADLMQELANYSTKIDSTGDFENVLQKIDGFRTTKNEASDHEDRERVARYLIADVDGRELRFPLFKERLTIGRTSQNDIQLNMQYVSRRHAVISTDLGKTRVIDWGSKNGVFVNDEQVTEHILRSGDVVSIGMADFKYEERTKR